jgi:hypothetical protein
MCAAGRACARRVASLCSGAPLHELRSVLEFSLFDAADFLPAAMSCTLALRRLGAGGILGEGSAQLGRLSEKALERLVRDVLPLQEEFHPNDVVLLLVVWCGTCCRCRRSSTRTTSSCCWWCGTA